MDRIVFENGKAVSSQYLNEVQKGDKFTGDTRSDYYADPTTGDEASWQIGQRDGLKDWEVADPREDQESALGRTAHDGIVLGWDSATSTVLAPGLPSTRPAGSGGIGVTVEAGSIISRSGAPISWARQLVQILGGANTVSYLYILESAVVPGNPVVVSVGSSLPSVTEAHIPLAKLTLNPTGTGLAVDPDTDEVVGTGYIDLRPNTFVGNLNTYPQNLTNTTTKTANYSASVWDRVIVDTSNGSIIVTLPASPNDSDRFAIVDIAGSFDLFPLILRINPTSNELINGSNDDWIVNIKDAHLELFYHDASGQWKFEEAPGSGCNPVLGTFLSCGGREYIGDRTAIECPDGQTLPSVYPNVSTGVYDFEPSQADPAIGKCYRVHNNRVALYSNGTGGLITVSNAQRCNRDNITAPIITRNTIHVDPSIGDDAIDNTGFDPNRPFRTIERALIEGARESRRSGLSNDRYDRVMIELAPGDYYVDNSPGSLATPTITDETGLIQRVTTGFTVQTTSSGDRMVTITVDVSNTTNTQPPIPLNLGRVLYSESGGTGNISRLEKLSPSGSIWQLSLEYVKGTFLAGDTLYYDNLSIVNPQGGGLIVPRGISVDGTDLRKVRVRPMYVPELVEVQNDPQTERTSIFKVTGGTYISLITFTDNLQYARSHNTVTSISFASTQEIFGGGTESSYYTRLNGLFNTIDNWGSSGLEALAAETTIVAPVASSKANRAEDLIQNQTGLTGGDSSTSATAYPGATKIRDTDGSIIPLPDVNSTRSSSPYVFNCSVRSIFGLNGMWADGSKVTGFKSMVTANFTQVSLQTDPECFAPTTYYLDPPVSKDSGDGKQYKTCSADRFKYRHFGVRGSNDASIQIVSVFVIGNADHFVAESGSDLSITNSCSDFGDISLRSLGYKAASFSQDEKAASGGYEGTRITKIIPPLPLSYNAGDLPPGRGATLEDIEINTGLTIQYSKTLAYVKANETPGGEAPETIRIYIQNSNISSPFTLTNPPSASDIAFGQFAYTKKVGSTWELTGGSGQDKRKRIYINGFDELGNSILYTGNLTIPLSSSTGFTALDDQSKIFVWDPTPPDFDEDGDPITGTPSWYIPVTTTGITEETSDLDGDGYLLKRFNYAFRYKLIDSPTGSDAVYAALDFIFDRSGIKIVRTEDKRSNEERIYRVVFEGFLKDQGVRRPQPYYIMEKQSGVTGYPLNATSLLEDDPLTISRVINYHDVFGGSVQNGKFVTYLTKGSTARRIFTGEYYPAIDFDYPESTEDPSDSITKVALSAMEARTGVYFSAPLEPSSSQIDVKVASGSSSLGIPIGLRRPSVIRASGHTWEWTGYLNYDTSLPNFQGDPLEQDLALGKIIVEEIGGRVYATGMNEEGNYYLGTTVFDLRSGEQFNISLQSDVGDSDVTSQVLNNVVIKNNLLMQDNSNLVFGKGTTIFLNNETEFKSLNTGDIVASNNPPRSYSTTTKAGLIQLASKAVIRGAKSAGASGISDKVAVSAYDLAQELDLRFSGSVTGGNGITVTETIVNPPGGDPADPTDDITQFVVSVGLPGSGSTVSLASLRLGSTSGHLVTGITNSVNPTAPSGDRSLRLVTEQSLFTSSWISNGLIGAGAISGSKLSGQQSDAFPVFGARGWAKINADGTIAAQSGLIATVTRGTQSFSQILNTTTSGRIYTITFTTPLPAGYVAMVTPVDGEGDHFACIVSQSATQLVVRAIDFERVEGSTSPTYYDEENSDLNLIIMF